MLFHLLYPLSSQYSFLNVFRYITTRSFLSFILATLIAMFWGKYFIGFMRKMQFGQIIRTDGPETHFKKAGTPTMGGAFILGSIFLALLVCGNYLSVPVILTSALIFSYFVLGFVDDYLKVLKKNTDGVPGKIKLLWQFLTSGVVVFLLIEFKALDTMIYLPFVKGPVFDLGYFYIVFASIVVVGTSNAVNLTDGLDGLAIGPIIVTSAALGLFAYVSGHVEIANYLYIPYVDGSGELMVIATAIIGAGVGFLWYNSYPAQIFMGDTGSLSLGGALGMISVITKNEFLFVLLGGVFFVEALSVILQVGSYKIRKKRIFKMAPIHHHFELKGWPETKVIVRFWIISLILAILAIATLKLR
jgi:phospho-N-acetylmuramoyl-pentapeptide-transferase